MTVTVLGIRHHGPGSARAVADALAVIEPDAVLIEGAPELDAVAALAAEPTMLPPVAGLVYCPDEPRRAAFYPFAAFSPEWWALRWGLGHGAATSFIDLAAAHQLAEDPDAGDATAGADGDPVRTDPLGVLAAAAGFDDPERWWEDAVEHRHRGLDAFAAVTEAMAALREDGVVAERPSDLRREAAMRRAIRAAAKVHERIVVVCGAWHAPVLDPSTFPSISHDAALLRNRPKVKVAATWVPWTHARLAYRSGYGAGVDSPGWYAHLMTAPDDVTARWLTRTAHLLRAEQVDTSPASVVEAVRLADALAALRERPLAGLAEMTDAATAVMGGGSTVTLDLVAERLLVGDDLGSVPPETPAVPLARDLERQQRRLRLRPKATEEVVTLDLRTPSHRDRSRLFHRLAVLAVPWGEQVDAGRTRGTFKEAWRLEWRPELSVALIDASGAGTTIEAAAAETLARRAEDADVAALTTIVEAALLADLPAAVAATVAVLEERSARQHDVLRLMAAIEPLARLARYGDVRRVDTEVVEGVLRGMAARVAIGLGPACASLDDDAAGEVRGLVDGVSRGLALLSDDDLRDGWLAALAQVADQDRVHGSVAGRATRILLDAGRVEAAEASARLSRALSRAADAAAGAAWLDGFLAGDAALLLHDPALLAVLDEWIATVPAEAFDDVLPLVRRTFSGFTRPERRQVGDRVRRLDGSGSARAVPGTSDDVDPARAARARPVLRQILGVGA
ncbi:MAG TPA: DUF5682 family protein [Iamia sp.]|jgi:hypothetical protein|nr:DUF5682 family protein [Iamia sp.]